MNSPHDGEFQTFLTPQKGEPSILSFGTDGTDNLAASSNRSFLSRRTRDWPFLTISMLLVVLSALCIHLLFQLHDLRASSMGLPPIPAVRDICFVHVGKTGGNSITTSLHALQALGSIGGAVEVHTSHDWPSHYKDVVMPSDEETVKRISSGLSPRNMTYRNTTHEGRHWWVQDSGFYAEAATMVRHYRRLGAPLSNATRKSAQYCPMTGHVVTWVRDPVSRLISVWNFGDQQRAEGNKPLLGDLNTVVEAFADKEVDDETRLSEMFDEFYKVSHATEDMAFFFGNSRLRAKTWKQRSTNCEVIVEGSLPFWFVGRSEHFAEDFDALLDKTIDPRLPRIILPHTHLTGRKGKVLSKKSVDLLRKFYSVDYECIQHLIKGGFLEEEYMDSILSDTKTYTY